MNYCAVVVDIIGVQWEFVVVTDGVFVFVFAFATVELTLEFAFWSTDVTILATYSVAPDTRAAVAGETCIGTLSLFTRSGVATTTGEGVGVGEVVAITTGEGGGLGVGVGLGGVVATTTGVGVVVVEGPEVAPSRNENLEKNKTKNKIPDKKRIEYKFCLFIIITLLYIS